MCIRESKVEGSERIYRFLLLLYPPGFRLRFGLEMLQVFRDIYPRNVHKLDLAKRLAFWLWTVIDLVRSLPREWRQALIRAENIELAVRRWADSLVVPFVVGGSLLVAGNLGATLVQSPNVPPTAHGIRETWNMASMHATNVAVALGLGILGIVVAVIAARSRRAERWIKL